VSTPWVIWAIVVFVLFAAIEFYALRHPDRVHTLSISMAMLGKRFPLTIGLFGLVVGGLFAHFWWCQCL
jgi:hypothetical protein